ncbi:CDT1 factor, partial [Nesospiza acunhae]|nr:CDT1 factor [Nesospiza acunhae]
MAQLRLTDFFGQTKGTTVAPAKRSGGRLPKAALAGPPLHREEEDGDGAASSSPLATPRPPTPLSQDPAVSPPASTSGSPCRGQDTGTEAGPAGPGPARRLQRVRADPGSAPGAGGFGAACPALTLCPLPAQEDVAELQGRLQRMKMMKVPGQVPSVPSGTSSDLRSRLERMRQLELRVRQRRAAAGDTGAGDTGAAAPGGETGQKPPAYQRFHTLAQELPPGLTLPYKFRVLAEMFRSVDTIAGMLFNRAETVTFAKVKQGVQDMMRRQFEEQHLGQIKAVYPSSYRLRQEKNVPTFGSGGKKKSEYQLTLEPVLGEEEKVDGRPHLSASRLLERRREFHRNLVNIVREHHPPMVVPEEKLTRWHPRFNVDEVPDIIPAELPQPPREDRLSTAQEVLSSARGMLSPKMEKALANLALRTAEASAGEPALSKAPAPASTSSALRGVSQGLLERVSHAVPGLTRGWGRCLCPSRPLRALPALRVAVGIFRGSLREEGAVGSRALTPLLLAAGEMEKHVRLFAELLPDWVGVHALRTDVYVKLDKEKDLGLVTERLNKAAKEAEAL